MECELFPYTCALSIFQESSEILHNLLMYQIRPRNSVCYNWILVASGSPPLLPFIFEYASIATGCSKYK